MVDLTSTLKNDRALDFSDTSGLTPLKWWLLQSKYLSLRMMHVKGVGVTAAVIPGHIVTHCTGLRLMKYDIINGERYKNTQLNFTHTSPSTRITMKINSNLSCSRTRHKILSQFSQCPKVDAAYIVFDRTFTKL